MLLRLEMQSALGFCISIEQDFATSDRAKELLTDFQAQSDYAGVFSALKSCCAGADATRGFVPPSEFIPVAEETGLIDEIGSWAPGKRVKQIRHWAISPETSGLRVSA